MSATNADAPLPTYVYKLVPHTSPVPTNPADLPEALPVSELDRRSGFIHLSTAPQVPGTLAYFFGGDPRVYVLRIPYGPLVDDAGCCGCTDACAKAGAGAGAGTQARGIRWEDPEATVCGPRPGEGLFPHLYNGLRLGRNEIESVWVLEKGAGGERGWAEVIEGDAAFKAWLAY